jgi:hypothetical protein
MDKDRLSSCSYPISANLFLVSSLDPAISTLDDDILRIRSVKLELGLCVRAVSMLEDMSENITQLYRNVKLGDAGKTTMQEGYKNHNFYWGSDLSMNLLVL